MLVIEPLETALPDISSVQCAMITSANAMEALAANDDATEALLDLPCFCVGPRTAESARDFGFRNVHNATGSGIALAQMIAKTTKNKGKAVLHIAAEDVDSRAQVELERGGFQVLPWRIYTAQPVMQSDGGDG